MSKLLKEFREFAVQGNMIDMAVGMIIGAAFKDLVNSLVSDMVMPVIGLFTDNGLDAGNITLGFSDLERIVQLIGGVLHTQEEQILLQGGQLLVELLHAHCTYFSCLHLIHLHPVLRDPRA